MITYDDLIKRPDTFKNLTGVSIPEFDELFTQVTPVWLALEHNRLNRPERQRAIGGGDNYKLALRERLLMALIRLHLCLNTEAVGYFFGIDKSTASRNTRRLLPALRQVSNVSVDWPEPPKRGHGKGVDQVLQEHPDLRELIDVPQPPSRWLSDAQMDLILPVSFSGAPLVDEDQE